jgi:hypothetical protein
MRNLDPEDQRDQAIAEAARRHAAAMRTNVITGHQQTLESLAEDFAFRLSQPGVTEQLIRTALSCGVHTAGNRLLDMIDNCIDDEAEIAAIKEIESAEADVTSKDRQHTGAMQVRREVAAAYVGGVAA